jgi:hypothetical protein
MSFIVLEIAMGSCGMMVIWFNLDGYAPGRDSKVFQAAGGGYCIIWVYQYSFQKV